MVKLVLNAAMKSAPLSLPPDCARLRVRVHSREYSVRVAMREWLREGEYTFMRIKLITNSNLCIVQNRQKYYRNIANAAKARL